MRRKRNTGIILLLTAVLWMLPVQDIPAAENLIPTGPENMEDTQTPGGQEPEEAEEQESEETGGQGSEESGRQETDEQGSEETGGQEAQEMEIRETRLLQSGDTAEEVPEQIDKVYQIGTAGELFWFAGLVNGTLEGTDQNAGAMAVLTADIDLNPGYTVTADSDKSMLRQWQPMNGFSGSFDGNGKTITGLYIESSASYTGFFGRIQSSAEVSVKDLTLSGSYIQGGSWTGGLCGSLQGSVENCSATETVEVRGGDYTGGLFGEKSSGSVSNCRNEATVSGRSNTGGIIGMNSGGGINGCSNTGVISSEFNRAGGICGWGDAEGALIADCENSGSISGRDDIGGIAGISRENIENCRSTGIITGSTEDVGGIAGEKSGTYSSIRNCINEGNITGGGDRIGGIAGYGEGTELKILQCCNYGTITGAKEIGGIAGRIRGYVENSFNTGNLTGTGTMGGISGVNEKSLSGCYNTGALTYTEAEKTGGITGERTSGGSVRNCYYLDTIDRGIGQGYEDQNTVMKSAAQFTSGNVTWELNQGVTDGSQAWYQTAGKGLPGFAGATIYPSESCGTYNNTGSSGEIRHSFDPAGFCTGCGCYQPAEQNRDGVYEIGNPGQLYWFAALVNNDLSKAELSQGDQGADAVLTRDIKIHEEHFTQPVSSGKIKDWKPIGSSGRSYTGTFDGDGHIIYGLYCVQPGRDYTGFTGRAENAVIRGLTLADSYISGGTYTGGISGDFTGNLENCENRAVVTGNESYTGGIVGYLRGSITDCNNLGNVAGQNNTGGILGRGEKNGEEGQVLRCENQGNISGTSSTGGICGITSGIPVTKSTNTGTIYSSGTFTGGITGRAEDSQEVPITRCRNAGSVQGADNTGGITGQGSAELCGNEGEVSGNSYVGGISGENSRGYIRNSYNWGTVEGNGYVGGVIGSIQGFGGNVEDCYSTGQITGSQNTGGVIGCYINNGPLGTNYYMAGTTQKGVGGGKDGPALPKEEGQFASGEVAWKLNQGGTDGSQLWYQDLDNGEEKDRFPVFEGGTVYPGTDCVTYTNTKPEGEISRQHDFGEGSNGFCKKCGQYQEAEKNQDDIYEISNGGQLYWFAALVNGDSSNAEIREKDTHADGMLTVDITVNPEPVTGEDLSGNLRTWEPAGSEGASYYGTFDGNGKTISGLYCSLPSRNNIGLFGHIHEQGIVKNLTVKDSYFSGNKYVGAICGSGWKLMENITDCYNVNTTVVGAGDHIGGIAGICNSGLVRCGNTGAITGMSYVGGLAGETLNISNGENSGKITGGENTGGIGGNIEYNCNNCVNSGEVMGANNTGGICGRQNRNERILNSFNTGSVSGQENTGGIAGSTAGTLEGCYNAGQILGTEGSTGSICGTKDQSNVFSHCYYLEETGSAGIGSGEADAGTEARSFPAEAFKDGSIRNSLQGYVYSYEGELVLKHWRQGEAWPVFVEGEPLIEVSITWDDMNFVYTEEGRGNWDPVKHIYSGSTEEGWNSENSGIRIMNQGNTDILAEFSYEPAEGMENVTGKFYSGSGEETTETEILAAISDNTPETSVNLGLSGKPEPFEGSQKIGSVTVRVQEAGTPDDEE
mgnify:FL=1